MMIVPLGVEPTLTPGTPTVFFEASGSLEGPNRGVQDIFPDGQHFLALMTPEVVGGEGVPRPPLITVVLHWTQELTERAPVP